MKVQVTFETDAQTPDHAKQMVKSYLKGKGVVEQSVEKLTLGREEKRWGYSKITVEE